MEAFARNDLKAEVPGIERRDDWATWLALSL